MWIYLVLVPWGKQNLSLLVTLQATPAIVTDIFLSGSKFGLFKVLEKAMEVVRKKSH